MFGPVTPFPFNPAATTWSGLTFTPGTMPPGVAPGKWEITLRDLVDVDGLTLDGAGSGTPSPFVSRFTVNPPVRVPVPEAELEGWPLLSDEAPEGGSAQAALDRLISICTGRHDLAVEAIDLDAIAASGLAATTMGRTIAEDPLVFASPLAAGRALAGAVSV